MTTPTLREAAQAALEALESLQGGCTDSNDGTVEAITVWCPEVIDALRAALAQPVPDAHAEPLKGWKLNHAQRAEEGVAEIGFLDDEEDRFSPIVTVDTGLYYQPDQALPLAVAILGMLQDAAAHPQQPARVPLTEERILNIAKTIPPLETCEQEWLHFAHRLLFAAGIVPAPTTDKEQS